MGGLIILTCSVKSRFSQYGCKILCLCKIITKSMCALTLIDTLVKSPTRSAGNGVSKPLLLENFISEKILYKQHILYLQECYKKARNKVNKQLLNLIRDNIGLISDPQKYEKCTVKAKKKLPLVVNFARYTCIFFQASL